MPVAEDVPVVKDQPYFVCAEAARLAAMQEAQDAATPEARLEATLLVTHLFQQQIDEMADVMSAVRELSPDAPERQVALDWVGAWTADGKEKFPQWAQYQNSLVAVVGRDRAQEIADGAAAARAQAVIDGAKARIAARVAEIEAG